MRVENAAPAPGSTASSQRTPSRSRHSIRPPAELRLGFAVRVPVPARHLVEGIEISVRLCPRVLLGNLRPELDVLTEGLLKRLIAGELGLRGGLHVEGDESLPLLVGDLQPTVHVDQVVEPEPLGEAIRAAEGLSREPGQMLDVMFLLLAEHGPEDRVGEHLRVEDLLEAVETGIAAGMLVERLACSSLVDHEFTLARPLSVLGDLAAGGGQSYLKLLISPRDLTVELARERRLEPLADRRALGYPRRHQVIAGDLQPHMAPVPRVAIQPFRAERPGNEELGRIP